MLIFLNVLLLLYWLGLSLLGHPLCDLAVIRLLKERGPFIRTGVFDLNDIDTSLVIVA